MFPTNNNTQEVLTKIPEALSKGTSGIILLPVNPTPDAIASACSLYLALTQIGKNVTIASSTPVQSDLVGADKIQNNISTGGDNLVISFPYQEGSLDKVDYGVQGNLFNIIITPRPGQAKLDPNKVKYSYTGGSLDFIITVDAPSLNSLGQIYTENQNDFNGKTIINIDRHLVNDMYGVINYVNKTSSSTSELVVKVLQTLNAQIDKNIATNLYAGITAATNNFTSYSVNADTFEAASVLLKAGAVKKAPMRPGMSPQTGMPSPLLNDLGMPQPRRFAPQQSMNKSNPFTFPQQNSQHKLDENMKAVEDVEQEAGTPEAPAAPQDWLKPKIFKGGGLV